jgi:cytolysin-activating lysine-acyltransferase
MQQTEQDRSGHSAARKRNGARAARSGDAAAEPIEMTVLSDEPTAEPEPAAATATATAEEAPPETLRREPNVYASAIWLMQLSRRHRHLFLADLEWALMLPLALKQFRLFHKDGIPVALATWAFVSDEVEERLKQGRMRLKPEEWKSGDNRWLIDVVAPPGTEKGMVQNLLKDALAGKNPKYLGRDAKTGKVKVYEATDEVETAA